MLGTSFMPEHAEVFLAHLRAGAARAGRSLADFDLQAGGVVAFGTDVERPIARREPGLAFTLGAMGSRQQNFYNAAFQRAGYADVAREVQALWLDRIAPSTTAKSRESDPLRSGWPVAGQHAVEPAQHRERRDHVLELASLEGVADQVRDAPEEAHDLAMVHAPLRSQRLEVYTVRA